MLTEIQNLDIFNKKFMQYYQFSIFYFWDNECNSKNLNVDY